MKTYRKLYLFFLLIAIFLFTSCATQKEASSDVLRVDFLDAGQGDCTLITLPEGGFILIDTSSSDFKRELDKILEYKGVKDFEMVIFTHPHSDHIANADDIVKKYGTNYLVMPDISYPATEYKNLLQAISDAGIEAVHPHAGDMYELGAVKITFLAPASDNYEDLNDYSVVTKLSYNDIDFLFCGDISRYSEYEMMEAGFDLSGEVLKVAHHGADTSTSPSFIEKVMPEYAVISCETGNIYSHPELSVVKRLEASGAQVLTTAENTVTITTDGKTITVE